MATRLYEVLTFTNVGAGAQASLPHHLNANGLAVVPDLLYPDASGFSLVSADATQITVQNNNAGIASLDLALVSFFSMLRYFGQGGPVSQGGQGALVPQPFFVSGGGSVPPGANLWAAGTGAGSVLQNNGSGNLAGGVNSISAGNNNHLTGSASFAAGDSNVETGADSATNTLTGNQNSIAHAFCAYVEGNRNVITGDASGAVDFNHVEGNTNHVTGTIAHPCDFNHVEGSGNTLNGTASACEFNHVEGDSHTVTDADTCHVEGFSHTVNPLNGTCNHVEGQSHTLNSGVKVNNNHVEGLANTVGPVDTAHIQGTGAKSVFETQDVMASGRFAADGDAQTSQLVVRGSTPGAAPGEAVELKFGSAGAKVLTFEDGKAYTIEVSAVAKDTVAGGKGMQSWVQRYAVRKAAGVAVIAGTGAVDQFGDAASATWTLAASIGAGPDRFLLTFTTVGAQAAAKCAATVRIVEVLNA